MPKRPPHYRDKNGVLYSQGLYRKRMRINVDDEMIARVRKEADKMNVSMAEAARILIEHGLDSGV